MTQIEERDQVESRPTLRFPDRFVWGVATSAYQIEGAVAEDGRGPSIWDTFSHTPGKVVGGDTGDVAADHYHRYVGDVRLMADLGVTSYRFSVAWPRILPSGSGAVNRAGLDFYSRLVDELLNHGITPALTLYHWDLPQALQDQGGWTNRATAQRFAEYAVVVARELGDRVNFWITLNEPWCAAFLGYGAGVHAPGHTDSAEALTAAHHLLLAHGLAVQALGSVLPPDCQMAITLNPAVARPASLADEDVAAARKVDGLQNRLWLDPLFHGTYPQDVVNFTSKVTDWSFVRDNDLAVIATPFDILGVNYYNPVIVGHYAGSGSRGRDGHGQGTGETWPGCPDIQFPEWPFRRTAMGWPIDPSGLYELLIRLNRDYPRPIMITENGAAFDDVVTDNNRVRDPARAAYIQEHLAALHQAIVDGVDVRGYYLWSLIDNFEWAYGYSRRFGIVYVDFETQERLIKDSGYFYSLVARTNTIAAP